MSLSNDSKTSSALRNVNLGFERIKGTGENGDNREIAFLFALFFQFTLLSLKATHDVPPINNARLLELHEAVGDSAHVWFINVNEVKWTDGVSGLFLPGASFEWVHGEDGTNREFHLRFLS
jgi:hypothetical protein